MNISQLKLRSEKFDDDDDHDDDDDDDDDDDNNNNNNNICGLTLIPCKLKIDNRITKTHNQCKLYPAALQTMSHVRITIS